MNETCLLLAIGLVAFLYSSVGHGGASGYLAILTVWGLNPELVRSSALVLNVFVAGIAFFSYYKTQAVNVKKLIPFLVGSVPAAFAGSLIKTDIHIYKILLGAILLIAVFRMLMRIREFKYDIREIPFILALIIGIAIGFISGLIGIGGGIILSPILILFRWAAIKETACLAAFFILVNSVTGLSGLLIHGFHFNLFLMPLILVALIGGLAGSWIGSRYLPVSAIKYTLAMVMILASFKLFAG